MNELEESGGEFIPAETLEIRDLETLKVMADTLRMQIVDLLRRDSATVKEIAASLKVPPRSLYYHVNLLEKHGLIRIVATRVVSGILEKRYRATAYLFNFAELAAPPGTSSQQLMLDEISSLFAITRDEIRIALESGMLNPDDDAPALSRLHAAWTFLDLSPPKLDELMQRVEALVMEYSSSGAVPAEQYPYRLLFTLFPTYRRGERPDVSVSRSAGGEST